MWYYLEDDDVNASALAFWICVAHVTGMIVIIVLKIAIVFSALAGRPMWAVGTAAAANIGKRFVSSFQN